MILKTIDTPKNVSQHLEWDLISKVLEINYSVAWNCENTKKRKAQVNKIALRNCDVHPQFLFFFFSQSCEVILEN